MLLGLSLAGTMALSLEGHWVVFLSRFADEVASLEGVSVEMLRVSAPVPVQGGLRIQVRPLQLLRRAISQTPCLCVV